MSREISAEYVRFETGRKNKEGDGILANSLANGNASCCPELSVTPAITGFMLHRKETHGAMYVLPANETRRRMFTWQ